MLELLQSLKDDQIEATFLFPSVGGAVNGRVEDLNPERVVIAVEFGDNADGALANRTVRFVTHPNSVVLVT